MYISILPLLRVNVFCRQKFEKMYVQKNKPRINSFNIDCAIGVFTVCIIKSFKVGDDGGGLLSHVICREASLIIPRCFDLNLKQETDPPQITTPSKNKHTSLRETNY